MKLGIENKGEKPTKAKVISLGRSKLAELFYNNQLKKGRGLKLLKLGMEEGLLLLSTLLWSTKEYYKQLYTNKLNDLDEMGRLDS